MSESKVGILNIVNQSYIEAFVSCQNSNDNEILRDYENIGHAFHGDIVRVSNGKIINVIKSNILSKDIVGVMVFNSKYKYGFNKKGSELFLFRPLSNHYPCFLVASKNKIKKNQYTIIKFLSWINTLPNGQLVRFIGDCSDLDNTYDAIIYKNNLTTKIAKQDKQSNNIDKVLKPTFDPTIFFKDLTHKNITDQYVFSVDPKGCEDIDDALSIIKNDDHYIVNIHIADVSFYFDYFNLTINNYSTIYAPHKNYSMIPDILARNICSLKPNKNRLAFTVSVKIGFDGSILDYSFEKTIINSKKAYDYDELQELLGMGCNDFIDNLPELDLYNVGKLLYKQNANYDTHKMVEAYMILANNLVGKYLYEKVSDENKNKIIYRVHTKKESMINNSQQISENKDINKEINDVLELLESNAAIYTTNTKDNNNYYHHGLQIDHYTHFTSPIRRYVDVYIHKLLNYVITGDTKQIDKLEPDCDKINEFNHNIKKTEREFNKIMLANELHVSENDILGAYILNIEGNKVTIYIYEHKIIHQIKLFDSRLAHLVQVNYHGPNIELINKKTGKSVTLVKYDKIVIKVVLTLHNDEIHKKIDMYIPEVHDLFINLLS